MCRLSMSSSLHISQADVYPHTLTHYGHVNADKPWKQSQPGTHG